MCARVQTSSCKSWSPHVNAQDVSGGAPVAVEGVDLPLWGMEVDVERARADIRVCLVATFLLYGADHQAALPRTQTLVIILSQLVLQSLMEGPVCKASFCVCAGSGGSRRRPGKHKGAAVPVVRRAGRLC